MDKNFSIFVLFDIQQLDTMVGNKNPYYVWLINPRFLGLLWYLATGQMTLHPNLKQSVFCDLFHKI